MEIGERAIVREIESMEAMIKMKKLFQPTFGE